MLRLCTPGSGRGRFQAQFIPFVCFKEIAHSVQTGISHT